MKKIFGSGMLILLLLSSTISASGGNDYDSKTSTPGIFLLEQENTLSLTKDSVVLLDLDETVLSTPTDGCLYPDNYYRLCKEQEQKHPELSPVDVERLVTPLFTSAAFRTPTFHLTDEQLPKAIELLKSKGCTVLGLTARESNLMPDTIKWLQQLNVNFSQVLSDDTIDMGENRNPLVIKNGIVFVGVTNTKGDALTALLDLGKLKNPDTILFIDDRLENLKTTREAIAKREQPITFIPVLSTYPQVIFKPYDSKIMAKALLHFLVDNIEKEEVKALLDSDAYTNELVTEQCRKQDDTDSLSLCDVLKAKYPKWQCKENLSVCKNTMPASQ